MKIKSPQEKVNLFIKKHSYTQEEFASMVPCSQSLISLWLSGNKPVSYKIAYGIQKASNNIVKWEDILRNQLYKQ